MIKTFLSNLPEQERRRAMAEQADRVEETTYFKPLSPEELDTLRERHTENAIKLSELEEKKREAMKDFKAEMDPLTEANKEILQDVKRKSAEVSGTLYHIADYDAQIMETYDERGEFISSRRLRPDEKQKNIFSISRAQ